MENTAKNFALQLGSLIALYVSIGSLISLLFSIITVLYPDEAQYAYEYENATGVIRTSIAFLVVFFPTYIILTRIVNNIRRKEHGVYLTLTKWLIYISLLVGGCVLLGDFVTILINFLNGELTIRFALKALAVFVIVTSAFLYYLLDARGYWQEHEKDSIRYAAVTSILICVAIVFGFIHTESPREVRELKIDATQIADLQNIQSHIEEYYHLKNTLPTTIKGTFMVNGSPEAPEGRAPYTYAVKDLMSFELCAEFTYPSRKSEREMYMQPAYYDGMILKNPNNWEHKSGKWCFERVVSKPSEVITKESL